MFTLENTEPTTVLPGMATTVSLVVLLLLVGGIEATSSPPAETVSVD